MWKSLFLFVIVLNGSQSRIWNPSSRDEPSYEPPPRRNLNMLQQKPPCTILPPPETEDDTGNLSLWELLEKSRREIQISDTYKDVILLLGNTGSGKTTVTQLLAGNASSLQVVSNQEKKLMITDPARKIGLTTVSRTLVPELVVDKSSGLALYDCPGFMDNRGPKVDITANFLLKKITDHVSTVKLVFVSIYSSVYGTEDKSGFDQLATSAIRLITNFEKLEKGIGLVVTKVPNYGPSDGHLLSDEETMLTITSFLRMYKSAQEGRLNSVRPSEDKRIIQKKLILSPFF